LMKDKVRCCCGSNAALVIGYRLANLGWRGSRRVLLA
jgi:hypothetical protein